jgi:hypothetical protein
MSKSLRKTGTERERERERDRGSSTGKSAFGQSSAGDFLQQKYTEGHWRLTVTP